MLRLKPGNTTVPDKFQFKFPDGHIVFAIGRQEWRDKINAYATDNNYPIPSDETIEDQLCRRLSGEWCIGGTESSFINPRFTLNDFLRGMEVLSSFAIGGEVVSQEVADARALTCSRCVANMEVPGCSSCTGMANAIASMKGAKSTKYDHLLKNCAICHCHNQCQVWIPAEYLAKGVTPEMMAQFREIPDCWKGKEVAAIDTE